MYYQRYSNGGNYFWIFFLLFLMLGGFRLLFFFLGLALAILINFFPLIIMGAIAYRFIKKAGRNRYVNSALNNKSVHHKRFVEIMVHILIHIAKADGSISQSETQMIRQFFISQLNFRGAQIEWINDVMESAKLATDDINKLANEFTLQFGYESQLMLLNMVYNIAYSDGVFHESEAKLIEQLSLLLKVSAFDHQRIKMAFEAQYGDIAKKATDDKYYAILGLTNSASKQEIKKTYRELSKKYHPDKVHHLGEEFKLQAEKKMQEINVAYDELMKRVAA
tara:strand:+ start:1874 stop:2710 length:837 start_codon:yes stop_codon:yes gene_type:complete